MADNVYEFKVDLEKFAELTQTTAEKVVRRVALELYSRITLGWPVDTGYSRANWRLSVGEPDLSVLPPPASGDKGQYPPPTPDLQELSSVDGKEPVFITNNVDYAVYLEEGSSQQAPSGVVRVSIDHVEAELNDIVSRASSE